MRSHLPAKKWVSRGFCMVAFCVALVFQVHAQNKTVSGTIKDTDGAVLPGVSIIEKGTTNGTTTDADGKYTLSVGPNAVVVFSFIGMAPQEITVGNQTTIDLALQADISLMDEIVVVGYGTQKRSDLTGSIVSVSGDDLKKMPVSSVAESLTGRLAGVQVQSTEGSPDAEIRIRVRGGTSLSQDNSPLYIVDGFPVANISDISPSDIKSIDVLKDASSTAIYGSRGANGVIIITTKGGATDGKVNVSVNTFTGFKNMANELDVLQPYDYAKWQYEYSVLADDIPSYEDYFGGFQDMDLYSGVKGNNWQQIVYGRTGKVFSGDISVRGGTELLSYSVNYARYQEKAIMVGSDFVRDNFTVKLNSKPNDKVDLSFSLRYAQTDINGGGANEQNEASSADSRLKHSVTYSPIPVNGLTSDDTNEEIASYFINPLTATADNDRRQERRNYNINGSFGWKLINNLTLRIEGGMDSYGYMDNRFYGLSTYYVSNAPSAENQDHPAVILRDRNEVRLRNTNTLNYDFKDILTSDHHLNLLLGQETLSTEVNQQTSTIHGFPKLFTSDEAFKLTTQGEPQSVDDNYSPDDKLLSFFTRANYDYKGRYLLSATYRADGSSKFSEGNRWGYFPSAAAAWKISDEAFMSGSSNWLDQLKLRVSYGEAGNNNIPPGQTVQSFVSSTNAWINGFDSFWAASRTMANPNLKWETTVTRNVGIDFAVLSSRLSGSLEFYRNNTKDQLIRFPIPGTGYDDQFRNLGETENKGIELSLTYVAIEKENYGLSFSGNISFNRAKVVSLGGLDYINGTSNWASTAIGPDFQVVKGEPLGQMYGYVNDGRYEVSDFEGFDGSDWILKPGVVDDPTAIVMDPMPGAMKLQDITGDGNVTADDKKIIGNANPKHTGGFIINGYAYGFDLTASFNWSYGNDVYNANKIEYTTATPQTQYRNLITMMGDGQRWTYIDPSTGLVATDTERLAEINAGTTMWSPAMNRYVFSSWAVEDGSFLRLNTLTLGYTLPADLSSKLKLKSLRAYATATNVFVITNYSGFDPEVSTRRSTPYTPGVDYSAYPRNRQFVFGLNFNF
jgi:TonB-dependent starch-binding outer membrane protein SusC